MAESVTGAGASAPALTPFLTDDELRTAHDACSVLSRKGNDSERMLSLVALSLIEEVRQHRDVTLVTDTPNEQCDWCGNTKEVRLQQGEHLCVECRAFVARENILSAIPQDGGA